MAPNALNMRVQVSQPRPTVRRATIRGQPVNLFCAQLAAGWPLVTFMELQRPRCSCVYA